MQIAVIFDYLSVKQSKEGIDNLSCYSYRTIANCLGGEGIIPSSINCTSLFKRSFTKVELKQKEYLGGKNISLNHPQATTELKAFIKKQVAEEGETLFILVGSMPCEALTGIHQVVTKYHGTFLKAKIDDELTVDVLPIIPPRNVLSGNAGLMSNILADVKKACDFAKGIVKVSDSKYNLPPTILSPSFEEAMRYMDKCFNSDTVCFDIETCMKEGINKYQMTTFSLYSPDCDASICIPIFDLHQRGSYFKVENEAAILLKLRDILQNTAITKIIQNASFELTMMSKLYNINIVNYEDTMIAEAVIDPDMPKDLGSLVSLYTNYPYFKSLSDAVFSNKGYTVDFWQYSALDSFVLYEIFKKQKAIMEEKLLYAQYRRAVSMLVVLKDMEQRGIRYDDALRSKMKADYLIPINKLHAEITALTGITNPKSAAQVSHYFYTVKNCLKATGNVKTATQTDEKSIRRLALASLDPEVVKASELILELRKLSKLYDNYLAIVLDSDKRLRCSFLPAGTKSGRFSSKQTIFKTGGNIQNVPYTIKPLMLIDENHWGFQVDLSQAENRITAMLAKEEKMLEAFAEGIDIHSRTAALMFGNDDESKAFQSNTLALGIGDGTKSQRDRGKQANHALNYGMGAKAFSLHYMIPFTAGQFIHTKYHSAYAKIKEWHNYITSIVRVNKYIENCYGRRLYFSDPYHYKSIQTAYSYIPQSTIADHINIHGLLFLFNNYRKEVKLLNQVHDSIVFEIPFEVGIDKTIEILKALRQSLGTPINYAANKSSISIPSDFELLHGTFKGGETLNLDAELSQSLLKFYEEHRITGNFS